MKKLRVHFLFASLLFSLASVAESYEFYVSPTGSDTNEGTEAAPFKNRNAGRRAGKRKFSLSVLLFYPDDYGLEECWSGDEFIDVVVI